jgi:hypothetical protein
MPAVVPRREKPDDVESAPNRKVRVKTSRSNCGLIYADLAFAIAVGDKQLSEYHAIEEHCRDVVTSFDEDTV